MVGHVGEIKWTPFEDEQLTSRQLLEQRINSFQWLADNYKSRGQTRQYEETMSQIQRLKEKSNI